LRRIRGGKEEAMRRIRGENAIRPRLSRRPSQELEEAVTFFANEAASDSRFALLAAQKGFEQDFRECEPGRPLPAATDKPTIFLTIYIAVHYI